MKLEEQVKQLGALGITLNDGIKLDDLLVSFDRSVYEDKPFRVLLERMGGEVEEAPWGRMLSDRVWFFETDCVESSGAYTSIVQRLALMSRSDDRVEDIKDRVDVEGDVAWVRYRLDDEPRQYDAEVSTDETADLSVVGEVMQDFEGSGYRFVQCEAGRSMIVVYMDASQLEALRALTLLPFEFFN